MQASCQLDDSFEEQQYSNQSESSSESTPTYNYATTTTNSISIKFSIYNTSNLTSPSYRLCQHHPQTYHSRELTQTILYESDQQNSQQVSNPASVVDQQQSEQIITLQHFSNQLDQQSFIADQNRQSPFFQTVQKQGMSQIQIDNLPSMRWSQSHQLFNHGQKCSVCFEAYQIGQLLRVMQCFHRFHAFCIDPWLAVKSSCPNCRTLCQEVHR